MFISNTNCDFNDIYTYIFHQEDCALDENPCFKKCPKNIFLIHSAKLQAHNPLTIKGSTLHYRRHFYENLGILLLILPPTLPQRRPSQLATSQGAGTRR